MVRVLLVEDSPELRELLERNLKDHDFDVVVAENGLSGYLKFMETLDFDVIVTDLEMPGRNGDELLEILRKSGYQTPAILMSGKILEDGEWQRYKDIGFNIFLSKPFDINLLETLIHEFVQQQSD
jgi:DNA-binding response OmpR family regulator